MSNLMWDRNTISNLIHLLREYEELWNPGHPDYKNPAQRERALKEILSEIKMQIPEVELSDIKIKIHSVRSQYQREIRSLKQLKEHGANNIIPKLWCFDELQFLSYIQHKQVTTNEEINIKNVEKHAGKAWSRKTTLTLIHMLEERGELWDRKHPDFKNVMLKKHLLNEILVEIQKEMPKIGIADLRVKIHTLRCQYRKEIRMLNKSKVNAVKTNNIKKPLLWCFNDLKFLSYSNRKEVEEETKKEIDLIELVNQQPSEMSAIIWSRTIVLTLIKLLKEHEELWNPRYPAYRDKAQKDIALQRILPEIEPQMPDVNTKDIKLKIHTLRSQYQRELRALEKLKRNGIDPDMIKPKLWCFNELQFLGDITNFENDETNKLDKKDISKRKVKKKTAKRVKKATTIRAKKETTNGVKKNTKQRIKKKTLNQVMEEPSNEEIELDFCADQRSLSNSEVTWIQIERLKERNVLCDISDTNEIKKETTSYSADEINEDISLPYSTEEEIVDIEFELQPIKTPTTNSVEINEVTNHASEESNDEFEFIAITNKPPVKLPLDSSVDPVELSPKSGPIWDRAATLTFINLLREHELLWNPEHPKYRNNSHWQMAYNEILNAIQIQFPNIEISDIKNKIHTLKSQYRREIRGFLKSDNNGITRPKLWCFDELDFLACSIRECFVDDPASKKRIQFEIGNKPPVITGVVWNRRISLTLIHMLETRVELWNREHPDFLNLPRKEVLLNEILMEIQKEMPDAKIADIRYKIHSLRCQYRREIAGLKKSNMHSDVDGGDIQRPKLWCFDELKFLSLSRQNRIKEVELIELVNRPSTTSGVVWNRPVVLTLIELLKEREMLWNAKHPDYKKTSQRYKTLNDILLQIQIQIPNVQFSNIIEKIHSLQGQYRREIRTLKRLNRNGVKPGDVIRPKLWCFYELQFLKDNKFLDIEKIKQPVQKKNIIKPIKKCVQKSPAIEVDVFADLYTAPITGVAWNRTNILYFIELLRGHEELWNLGHPSHRNLAHRDKALNEILTDMQKIMPDIEMRHIKCKIHSLRSQYRREIRDMQNTEDVHRPKLWCFDELQFLGYSAYTKRNQVDNEMERVSENQVEHELTIQAIKEEAIHFDTDEGSISNDTEEEVEFDELEKNHQPLTIKAPEDDRNLKYFVLDPSSLDDEIKKLTLAKRNIKIAAGQLNETKRRNSIQSQIIAEKRKKTEHERAEVVGLSRLENAFSQILKRISR